jgi:hypothetical protein
MSLAGGGIVIQAFTEMMQSLQEPTAIKADRRYPAPARPGLGRNPRRGREAYELVLSDFKSELQRTKSPLGAELTFYAKPGLGKTLNCQPMKVDI